MSRSRLTIVSVAVAALIVAVPTAAARMLPIGSTSDGAALSYPSSVSFGRTTAGGATTRGIVFANVGRVPATVGPVGLVQGAPGGFGMETDDCGGEIFELMPGESCTYVIRFAPPAATGRRARHYAGTLVFAASTGEGRVRLTGVARPR